MSEICTKCGLPRELCVCETIAKESLKIVVRSVRRKFGKKYTLVSGVEDVDVKELLKKLKSQLACGGTLKNSVIELQGDHRLAARKALLSAGFAPETIELKE